MPRRLAVSPTTGDLIARILQRGSNGLLALSDALHYARHLHLEAKQFALAFEELNRLGLSSADCRWLVAVGILASPTRANGAKNGERNATAFLKIKAETSLVMTDDGQQELAKRGLLRHPGMPAGWLPQARRPRWDAEYWELSLGDDPVVRLIASATSQAVILAEFEKRDWPRRIPNPIKARTRRQSAQQLRDAVHGLNEKQNRVRFRTGGRGSFVEFEVVEDTQSGTQTGS